MTPTRRRRVPGTNRVPNLNADLLDGYHATDVQAVVGSRTMAPCTFDGTNVSCTGPCTWSEPVITPALILEWLTASP